MSTIRRWTFDTGASAGRMDSSLNDRSPGHVRTRSTGMDRLGTARRLLDGSVSVRTVMAVIIASFIEKCITSWSGSCFRQNLKGNNVQPSLSLIHQISVEPIKTPGNMYLHIQGWKGWSYWFTQAEKFCRSVSGLTNASVQLKCMEKYSCLPFPHPSLKTDIETVCFHNEHANRTLKKGRAIVVKT